MPSIHVHFLPELVTADSLSGARCVVVDILRATTTILEALGAGATSVVPCLTIDDARQRSAGFAKGTSLLGGERGGRPIVGFDLGNSPAEYTATAVAHKTVILTTTNGTKALLHCAGADETLIGAFTNLSALAGHLQQTPTDSPVHVVCSGTNGQITREDVFFAGALVDRLAGDDESLDDQTLLARDAWRLLTSDHDGAPLNDRLAAAMQASRGGRNLIEIGMGQDIQRAAQIDSRAIIARFDAQSGVIQLVPCPLARTSG